jgi:hypothetical protein
VAGGGPPRAAASRDRRSLRSDDYGVAEARGVCAATSVFFGP